MNNELNILAKELYKLGYKSQASTVKGLAKVAETDRMGNEIEGPSGNTTWSKIKIDESTQGQTWLATSKGGKMLLILFHHNHHHRENH